MANNNPTLADRRKIFLNTSAPLLARQVAPRAIPASNKSFTKRAAWFEDDDVLVAVVPALEGREAQEVLAYGVSYAGSRTLRLVLPETLLGETRARWPFLTHPIEVFSHDVTDETSPGAVTVLRKPTTAAIMSKAGGPEKSPALYFGGAHPMIAKLARWATTAGLEPTHRRDVRSWSHRGQRVLTISGTKAPVVKAGIDAKNDPARTFTVASLDEDAFATVEKLVARGKKHAEAEKFQAAEEHHLQARLTSDPGALGLEHPLLREVPAFRPSSDAKPGRGFIDLVGLDGNGDIVLVETKLKGDHMIVLQGLDYWVWAQKQENLDWLRARLNASPKCRVRILYAVAGIKGGEPSWSGFASALRGALAPEIETEVLLIEQWKKGPIKTRWLTR